MELEICYREEFFVETSHHRQIWGRGWRLVFERSEGSLWCVCGKPLENIEKTFALDPALS